MKQKNLLFISSLAVVAFAVRLFRIGSQSLWVDEILTLGQSIPDPGLTIWDYLKYNIHGAIHSFVVYLCHFVSMNDGWLRFPSAVAGALGVVYFYRWVQVWLGDRIATTASVLLVVHPLHVYYSQEVRNYSFLFFFAMVSNFYLHRILSKETPRHFSLYVVGIVGAALSNFAAAFLYVVHAIIYLFRKNISIRRVLRWVIVSIFILILLSPWIYRIYVVIDVARLVTPVMPGQLTTTERLRGETTVGPEAVPYLFYVYSVGFSLGPSLRELHLDATMANVLWKHWPTVLGVVLVFGVLGVAGAVHIVRCRLPWVQVGLYLFVPIIFTLLLCWQNAKAFNVRYVLLGLPAYLCLVAAGVLSVKGAWRYTTAALVLATLIFSLGNYYFNGRYAREDVRGAAREIAERAAPADCILTHTVTEVFEHYFDGPNPVHSVFAPPGTPLERVDQQVEGLFANCDTVWYLRAREWVADPEGYLVGELDRRYHQAELIELNGVTLYRYIR
ncbi:MAG: glycosyltransferase family 39 protein [Candidatus Latescibacterota bacterium]|nr:MAG: glycosyltransferase family 39 protein [Candidatus Latescibacterota bacterium]